MEAPAYPKRFYKSVSLGEVESAGFTILLDGRQAKTPAKNILTSPSHALGEAMVREWDAHEVEINPYEMPISRRRMVVLDQAETDREKWLETITSYLQSDLLCYRAERPEDLVARQLNAWMPYLQWLEVEKNISLEVTSGIISVTQPNDVVSKVASILKAVSDDEMSCIAGATEMSGSAVLALALWQNFTSPEAIFAASRVDEEFQAEKWGIDAEAAEAEQKLRQEFMSVAIYLKLLAD